MDSLFAICIVTVKTKKKQTKTFNCHLDRDLKAVKATRLRDLDLAAETLGQVLGDDAVARGKKRKDQTDKLLLVSRQHDPVILDVSCR